MIKAAFFDIDGTLTDTQNHTLPESTKIALHLLREKGIKIIVSTGRAKSELIEGHILEEEPFDGYIFLNGQLTLYDNQIIDEHRLSFPQLTQLKHFLIDYQVPCLFYDNDSTTCNFVNDELIYQQSKIGSSIPPVFDISHLEDKIIYQFVPLVTVEQEAKMLQYVSNIKTARWGDCIVDAINLAGGKDIGVQKVCQHLGIDLTETIGFGDGENDIPMLQVCHIAVAMGNASDKVKQHANYIAKSFDNDGIYDALKDLKII